MTTEKILLEYDPKMKNLLPALKKVSAAFGYISAKDAEKIAEYFSLELSKVYETASFYDEIKTERQPNVVIQVCSSINCVLGNSSKIIKEIENLFHIRRKDEFNPKLKIEEISCLGRCEAGPIVIINNKIYEKVTSSSVHKILEEWI